MVLEFIFCLLTTPKCVLDEFDRAMLQLFAWYIEQEKIMPTPSIDNFSTEAFDYNS